MAQVSAAELARIKAAKELAAEAKKYEGKGLNCGDCNGENCSRCNITYAYYAEGKFGGRTVKVIRR